MSLGPPQTIEEIYARKAAVRERFDCDMKVELPPGSENLTIFEKMELAVSLYREQARLAGHATAGDASV